MVGLQNLPCLCITALNNGSGLFVDDSGSFFAVWLGERSLGSRVVETAVANSLVEAVNTHHGISLLGDFLQVAQCTGRNFPEGQLFRSSTTQRRAHLIKNLFSGGDVTLFWEVPCSAKRLTARHNGHLHQRRSVFQHPTHCGMPCFVESNGALLLVGDEFVFLFQTTHDPINGVQKVLLAHLACISSRGNQGSFIANVGDVCSAESRSLTGQKVYINAVVGFQRSQVHVKNGFPFLEVRHVHIDLPVKTTSTHEGAVQNVSPVGGRQNDDTTVCAKSIHLRQQLVEGVFALIIGAHAGIFAPGSTNGINFVNEHNARTLVFGLLEQIADTACPHTHEHFHEI